MHTEGSLFIKICSVEMNEGSRSIYTGLREGCVRQPLEYGRQETGYMLLVLWDLALCQYQ